MTLNIWLTSVVLRGKIMEIKLNIRQVVWYRNKNGLIEKGEIIKITLSANGDHSYILNYAVKPLVPFAFTRESVEYPECDLYASAEELKKALIEEIDRQIKDLL